jgi:catechol 2,3-dioxygenase
VPSPITQVQLRVADLKRAEAFYFDLLGVDRSLLTLREVPGLRPRPRRPQTAGLYHVAWLVPSRADLGRAIIALEKARYPLTGASDHSVSESLYLDDPDGNGVEIYADRPRETWQWKGGRVHMTVDPLDVQAVLAAGTKVPAYVPSSTVVPPGTVIGHVHFTVSDMEKSIAFLRDDVGMDVTFESPMLVGLSIEQYHHHANLNTWAGSGARADDPGVAGLDSWTFNNRLLTSQLG